MNENPRGLDPNSATGTKGSTDPETGTYGTSGTPFTTGHGESGSTVGTGSSAGEQEQKDGDFTGGTPNSSSYNSGGVHSEDNEEGHEPREKPSQAEGDRETIEEDIRDKAEEGKL